MFGFFEASGRAIAELRQPGIKPAGAPKRITGGDAGRGVWIRVEPGDVFVTRHDDALSNLFLPGFWPHAALYLGACEELARMGFRCRPARRADHGFWNRKKTGCGLRRAEETLQVDAFVVLRPPLEEAELATAIRRAGHVGKPYDFTFDFRTADRMVCTEVIYRGFHGHGSGAVPPEGGGRAAVPAGGRVSRSGGGVRFPDHRHRRLAGR